jgi:Luciferase-like monooxygenase
MEFGVNLNNREPLITADYTLADLLDLAELAEQRGFGSVWVGDSLFSKPRYEPISLLSAISQRTSRAGLGTACLVTSTRNPLYLALEWATLDQMSGGRTVLGACMGNPEHGVRREFEALEGFGRWPISVADIEATIGNAKKAIARLEGKKRVRVTSPAGTDVVVSIERRPALEVVPVKQPGAMMGPAPLWGEVAYAAVEDQTNGTIVIDGNMLGIGIPRHLENPITWHVEDWRPGTSRWPRARRSTFRRRSGTRS